MNETKTIPMMIPKYVSEFRCIGGECPDSCCANWNIPIDKGSFAHYRRVVHPVLKPLIKSYLFQDKENRDSFALHAKLNLRETDGHCPMHSDSGLCSIQLHLGEASLSDTCFMYPRTVMRIGDRIEQSLTLSCPEAARLALTNRDAFDFVETELTVRKTSVAGLVSAFGFPIDAMDTVRTFAVQLFQTHGLTNVERLAALGWLCHQIDTMASNGTHNDVSALLTEMTGMVESGSLSPLVQQLEEQPSIGVTVFYILFKNQKGVTRPPQQQEVVDWVCEGLSIESDGKTDLLKIEQNYHRGLSMLKQDSEVYEWAMNRYLLNDLLRETFPWGQTSAMLHYRRLLTRFGILRLMLCGVAAFRRGPLDHDVVVQTVQVFCRLYQHNDGFAKNAELCLQDLEWNSLERLYTLLK